MNTNKNSYIITYATVMVVLVAVLLSVAALSLKSRQEANKLNENKNSILSSLDASGEDYDAFITGAVLDPSGTPIQGADVFASLQDLKESFAEGRFPIFEAKDGRVVIPMEGTGLWGPISGYLALDKDMSTITGVVMSHVGETPGLGAEIASAKHWALYPGKQIFEGDSLVGITLRKGGAQDPKHEVDAISGGTKTSDGVTGMFKTSLAHYLPYFEKRRVENE